MVHTKVLVVDQEDGGYEMLKPGLSKHGYEIHTTRDIPNALALAGAHPYKAAFVSATLVDDSSWLDGLRAEIPDLPVILILPSGPCDRLSPQVFTVASNAIGKPLALELVCLILDQTMELMSLRARVRQQRQAWDPSAMPQSWHGKGVDGETATVESFEQLLVNKLRYLMPSLEVLGQSRLYRTVLTHVEKILLTMVLQACRGNQVKSAEILGINRNTLRKKLRELGLSLSRENN